MSEPTASDLAETVERAMWNSRANSSWYLDAVAALDALVARVDTLSRERDEAREENNRIEARLLAIYENGGS